MGGGKPRPSIYGWYSQTKLRTVIIGVMEPYHQSDEIILSANCS